MRGLLILKDMFRGNATSRLHRDRMSVTNVDHFLFDRNDLR